MHTNDSRARQSIRLDEEIWNQIDKARKALPGKVARNTWIMEAILEKLEREQRASEAPHAVFQLGMQSHA